MALTIKQKEAAQAEMKIISAEIAALKLAITPPEYINQMLKTEQRALRTWAKIVGRMVADKEKQLEKMQRAYINSINLKHRPYVPYKPAANLNTPANIFPDNRMNYLERALSAHKDLPPNN